jgi:hypothetical protein
LLSFFNFFGSVYLTNTISVVKEYPFVGGREAWTTSQETEDKREKIQALSLAKECYSMKLELLTNATVVDDAIRFVAEKSKDKEEQVKSSSSSSDSSNENIKESKEPDYNDEKSDKVGEEK